MGEHKRICGIVGKRAEESGSIDGHGAVAHDGIEDVSNLTNPVKITKLDGRAKDGDHGFLDRGVALWQRRHSPGVGEQVVDEIYCSERPQFETAFF